MERYFLADDHLKIISIIYSIEKDVDYYLLFSIFVVINFSVHSKNTF